MSIDKQLELLDFAEFLAQKSVRERSSRSIKGLWSDLDIDMSEEDRKEARQEIWGACINSILFPLT